MRFHILRKWLACALYLAPTVALEAQATPAQYIVPHSDVVEETRGLATQFMQTYVLLRPGEHKFPAAGGYSLVIALHGLGGNAPHFAIFWTSLVDSRSDVVVAVPEALDYPRMLPIIVEIIDDAVAHFGVNPRRVFLAGYSAGATSGSVIAGLRPDLFAGFAAISGGPDGHFFSPAMKKNTGKMALFVSSGTAEENDQGFALEVGQFKDFGFTHIATGRPDSDHHIPKQQFDQLTKDMMSGFDLALAANYPKVKADDAAARLLANSMVTQKRELPQSKGSYVFLTPDRTKFPAPGAPTLLICLHGRGDTAASFAANWANLVKSRTDIVVAVPEAPPGKDDDIWGPDSTELVSAIIADTVARDQIDPRHVILAGTGAGCTAAAKVMGEHPELFLGFANFATELPDDFFTPDLRKNAPNLAVYYLSDTNGMTNDDHSRAFMSNIRRLESFGFNYVPQPADFHQIWAVYGPTLNDLREPPSVDQTNLLVDSFNALNGLTPDEFHYQTIRMMHFFDQVMENQANKAAAATTPVLETRTLDQPAATYALLKSGRPNLAATSGTTLLICLHGSNETTANLAKYWSNLVEFCPRVIVAMPEIAPGAKSAGGKSGVANMLAAMIADTVARDQVNPRQVILAGYGTEGGQVAGVALGERPDLFAGFAAFATRLPDSLFTPALRKNAGRMAVFYEIGSRDSNYDPIAIAATRAKLNDYGFGGNPDQPDLHAENKNLMFLTPRLSHDPTVDQFNMFTQNMINFFFHFWAANGKQEALAAGQQ